MKKKIQKPFDAQAAKNGARVERRDGKPVRIICYDRVNTTYPIIALIKYHNGEYCFSYDINGKLAHHEYNNKDLVIIEEVDCPKFNVGDWIFRDSPGASPLLIVAIISDCYMLQDLQGHEGEISQIAIYRFYRLWTIKDTKPGDVLVCKNDNNPFIFKGCIDGVHPEYPVAYCGINCNGEFVSNPGQNWWTNSSVRPTTYKERQQFFNRLKEEGYKWDAKAFILWKRCN